MTTPNVWRSIARKPCDIQGCWLLSSTSYSLFHILLPDVNFSSQSLGYTVFASRGFLCTNTTFLFLIEPLRRYGHLKFFQDGGVRHLGFVRTGNSAVRSAVPKNPTLEPTKHEVDRITRCRDMAIRVGWGIWNPYFGEGEVVGGQR